MRGDCRDADDELQCWPCYRSGSADELQVEVGLGRARFDERRERPVIEAVA